MKNILVFLLTFFLASTVFSQVVFQEGIARELNSNKKALSGVFIKFENSSSANTDNSGNFRLAFQDKKAGDVIFLEDIKKNGYEIVNRKDFEVTRITNSERLATDIILAKAGVIDAAKMKYYGVSDKALLQGLNEEKERLKANLKSAKLKQSEYFDQLEKLQELYDNQKKNLDDLAEKFARVNFDDVGPVYREALELFQNGQINEAISLLEGSNPTQRTADIIKEQNRIAEAQTELDNQRTQLEKDKNDQVQTIKLLADMYTANFELEKAELQYDQLLLLDSTNLETLIVTAYFYFNQHLYEKAIRVNNKIVVHPNAEIYQVADAQRDLGDLYNITGNIPKALEVYEDYHNKYNLLYSESPESSYFKFNLAISYERIGNTHLSIENLDKALNYFEEGLSLSLELYETNPENEDFKFGLIILYERLGDTHLYFENMEKALDYFVKDLDLSIKLSETNPQDAGIKDLLANAYGNLGEIYYTLENFEMALVYYEKDLECSIEAYNSNPLNVYFKQGLANAYGTLGDICFSLDSIEVALIYLEKDLALYIELYEEYPLNVDFKERLATSYLILAEVYSSQEKLGQSLDYLKRVLELCLELYNSYPQNVEYKHGLAFTYANLGEVYGKKEETDKAISLFHQSKVLLEELVRDNPQNSEFPRYLAKVNDELKELEE